jgi:hypothetical protein
MVNASVSRGRGGPLAAAISVTAATLLWSVPPSTARDDDKARTFPKGEQGCFRRAYDAGHLARNRGQGVVELSLLRGGAELAREAIDGPEAPEIGLRLTLRLRSGARAGPEAFDCNSRDADEGGDGKAFLQCASVCGRGSIDVVPGGDGRLTIRIGGAVDDRLIADAVGIGRRCTDDSGVYWLGDATGDRVFVLDRAPVKECR